MKFVECVLYDDFTDAEVFEAVADYAERVGALVWANKGVLKLTVSKLGHERVIKYAKSLAGR